MLCGGQGHFVANCELSVKPNEEIEALPRVACVTSNDQPGHDGAPAEALADASQTAQRLTVVVTTSPVPSNPSTMMLEAVLASFKRVPGLAECPLVVVCDGFRPSKCGIKSTWKAGQVTDDAATLYAEYKANLRDMLADGRLPAGTRVVELEGRNGQAMAVKAGLAEVRTPLVLVHQHDLEFLFDFNLPTALDVLESSDNDVKYLGLPLLTNLHYEGIAWQHHGVRVNEVAVGGLRLVPIIFWYDSTHLASVDHYRSLVFGPEEAYRAGAFVEETFGVRQRAAIMAGGMAVHPRFGTYHCLSHAPGGSRRAAICHLNGVRFLTPTQRLERGFPVADPPKEFFPSRVMVDRRQRRLKPILDAIMDFSGVGRGGCTELRNMLSSFLNETRLRTSDPASECLPKAAPFSCQKAAPRHDMCLRN